MQAEARSQEQIEIAETALANGDLPAALAAFDRACATDSTHDEWRLTAATLQLKAGDPFRAAELAAEALGIRPCHPVAMDVLARACREALQPGLARRLLCRAAQLAPYLTELKEHLADADEDVRALRRTPPPKEELLHNAHLLPQEAIARLLKKNRVPGLAACIVLRDGQCDDLPDCLDSVRAVATEVVIVDCRAQPTELHAADLPKVTVIEFGEAEPDRQPHDQALRSAHADWCLILDANERLEQGSDEMLQQALVDPTFIAHVVELCESDGRRRLAVRLVRNAPGLHLSGRLIPNVAPSLACLADRWGLEIGDVLLRIERTSPHIDPRTEHRQPLLERDLRRDPDDRQAMIDRGRLFLESGQPDEALALLTRARRRVEGAGYEHPLELEEVATLEALCLIDLGRPGAAASRVESYHATHQALANTVFLQGLIARAAGNNCRAVERFVEALELEGHPGFAPTFDEIRGPELPNLVGVLLREQGELKQSREAFELAVARDEQGFEAQLGLAELYQADRQVRQVLATLERLIERHGENPHVWLSGAELLSREPQLTSERVDWLQQGAERLPDNEEIRHRLVEAREGAGHTT